MSESDKTTGYLVHLDRDDTVLSMEPLTGLIDKDRIQKLACPEIPPEVYSRQIWGNSSGNHRRILNIRQSDGTSMNLIG